MGSAKDCTDGQCHAVSISKDQEIEALEAANKKLLEDKNKLLTETIMLNSKLRTAHEFIKSIL